MKNRTTYILFGWTIFGAVAATAISYWNLHILFGFFILWLGGTALLLMRSLYATQHKQSRLLAQVSKRNVEDRAELRRQSKVLTDLGARTRGTSQAIRTMVVASEESRMDLQKISRTLQALELNQEYIADRYLDRP